MNWKYRPKTIQAQLYNGNHNFGAPTKSQLAEEHHHYYGRSWVLGRCMFETLLGVGVLPSNKILDFGCGSGRLAIWLAKFLDTGCYFGIESHFESIDAFLRYEIPLHKLQDKLITVSHDSNVNFEIFDTNFDVVVDAYASVHLNPQLISLFRLNMAKHTKMGGLYITCPEPIIIESLPIAGFMLERTLTSNCDLLSNSSQNPLTNWYIYRKISQET